MTMIDHINLRYQGIMYGTQLEEAAVIINVQSTSQRGTWKFTVTMRDYSDLTTTISNIDEDSTKLLEQLLEGIKLSLCDHLHHFGTLRFKGGCWFALNK